MDGSREEEVAVLKFYFNLGPNPLKVALLLEELGAPYEVIPVDARKGQQFTPEFLAINPNAKLPVIIDGEVVIFDSNAILLYLAEKTGRFLPDPNSGAARGQLLSWLMFIATGIAPYSGQANHFRNHAPEPKDYALNRYDYEAERHWKIIDEGLGRERYVLGETYTILDMSLWGWAQMLPHIMGDKDVWSRFPSVERLLDEINQRPAAEGVARLKAEHSFKPDWDDEAKRNLFPQLKRLGEGRPA